MNHFLPAPIPSDIANALEARRARLGSFASRVVYFETVGSTNDVADRLAADGAPHGTVVVADAQDRGRGRMGRTWFSPPGAGLYVSVVLRPEVLENPFALRRTVTLASSVSLTAGVAIAEAVRAATGLPAGIKWPNDLVVERRKLCGILAEACSSAGHVLQHVILGYGINVRPAAYPPDIADRATSLETELGRPVDRAEVLAESLACLAEWLPSARAPDERRTQEDDEGGDGFARMLARWRELSPSSVGARVEVLQAGGTALAGKTAGLDTDGALLVSVGGEVRRVIAGEVRWL